MQITLPLDTMTINEKIEIMETIWEDLRKNQSDFQSPDWHQKVLSDRENNLKIGKEKILSLEESKNRINKTNGN